jgi:hypothetical protein
MTSSKYFVRYKHNILVKPEHNLVSNRLNRDPNPHRTGHAVYVGVALTNRPSRNKKNLIWFELVWDGFQPAKPTKSSRMERISHTARW